MLNVHNNLKAAAAVVIIKERSIKRVAKQRMYSKSAILTNAPEKKIVTTVNQETKQKRGISGKSI